MEVINEKDNRISIFNIFVRFIGGGFGLQPGNLIRHKVNNASCLECEPMYYLNGTFNSGSNNIIENYVLIKVNNTTIESGAKMTLDAPVALSSSILASR